MAAATMCEEESSLTSQCLAFCQALASQGKAFTFSLEINSTFSFSLDTRENQVPTQAVRKKISPSTQRRNARRRQEFLKKKQTSSPPSPATPSTSASPLSTSTPLSSSSSPRKCEVEKQQQLPSSCSSCNHNAWNHVTGIWSGSCGDICPAHHICPLCEKEVSERESRLPRWCGYLSNDPHGYFADTACSGNIREYDRAVFLEMVGI